MKSRKKFTNTTFTKRVDHEAGAHRPTRAHAEPAVCQGCGAVYANRRWNLRGIWEGQKHHHWRPAQTVVCPACQQGRTGEPRGFVFVDGAFFISREQEVRNLIENEAAHAAEENPLARILQWRLGDGRNLVVSTTTEHLAQRLGKALRKAFGGSVKYDFSHENKLARVTWQRP